MNVKKTTIGTKASHLRIGLLYPAAEREQCDITKLYLIETVSDLFSRTAEKSSLLGNSLRPHRLKNKAGV
jgi:hypothetical protein